MSKFLDLKEKFKHRHNGPNQEELSSMLRTVGVSSMEELMKEIIPSEIRLSKDLDLDVATGEQTLLDELKEVASENRIFKSFIGMGYYDTFTPGVILRNVLENPGWYTAYTPYQAEISQGRLNALLNYQTLITDLTGMEIANASLLDEGTAAAEAMFMFRSLQRRKKGNKFFVSEKLFPQTIDVLKTRAIPLDIELIIGDHNTIDLTDEYFGAIVQYPDGDGQVNNYKPFIEKAHGQNILVAVAADIMSLVLLTPPGKWGADCVVGTSQRFGVPMGYGGPHAGFFATKDEFKRQVPGRIIGVSKDSQGNNAYRMALQTREQHIRREKATSNICTAQVLLANIAAFYAIYHGPEGLKQIATRIHLLACTLNQGLEKIGVKQTNTLFFDTLRIELNPETASKLKAAAEKNKINLRYFDDGSVGIALDETKYPADIQDVMDAFAEATGYSGELPSMEELYAEQSPVISPEFRREGEMLTHQVFRLYHSETKMLRYLKWLENKDLSLVHSMIPLGSCTMKLNATTEMIPVTWPEFGRIHPFVPGDQVMGYKKIIDGLSDQLKEITGFPGMSLQPNAGAQGEYAGLMVIREYLQDKGEGHRNVALIPSSAHGTNPASAVLAGMNVVVVACDENGNIDLDDLRAKAEKNKDNLAALMVTYPSTHGVYEESIREVCRIVHQFGGQVYMDGANMNAQVGLTNPAMIGADVCHLNLHKTFCIPHGGGGPGMGPIGVAEHLIPYLPGHAVVPVGGSKSMNAVSAAPYGSASILLISYIYIRLMGRMGLKEASMIAILNANYLAAKLKSHFDILYKGKNDRVAHEMILDTRKFKEVGIEVEDIAKRLMDYGFHAPTMSFPVPGTLMVEPTESEAKDELDRFCEVMISIKEEIDEVARGEADKEDNVLKNAPHTLESVISDNWDHKYSREKASYPLDWLRINKFWPSVGRVDSSYGDRNLYCVCPPMNEYMEEEQV